MTPYPAFMLPAALVGACLGSFAATAGLRAARGEQVLTGRSHCDHCARTLGFRSTLPLVSYVAARGTCGACGESIDPLHLAGELAGVLIGVAVVFIPSPLRAMLVGAMGLVLLMLAVADLRSLRIPDLASAAVAAIGLTLAGLSGLAALLTGLAAGAVTFAVMEGFRRGYLALRHRPGLGQGDVKLLAALAIWLGLATPWSLVGAAGLGLVGALVTGQGHRRFAFGPYLAAAGWLTGLAMELWPAFGRVWGGVLG